MLFVGRITRQKGVTHLVDAVKYLPVGTQVVLCAGAPDTPEIATEMRTKVEEARKSGGNIVWIEKMVTKAEAIQLYTMIESAQEICFVTKVCLPDLFLKEGESPDQVGIRGLGGVGGESGASADFGTVDYDHLRLWRDI